MKLKRLSIIMCAVTLLGTAEQVLASPASSLMKALGRYVSGTAAEEGGKKITKEISEEVVERVATRVVRESGEESLERVSVLVVKHGPDVIRAIDNAPDVKSVLKALDELPVDDIPIAVSRLAAGKQGKELAKATQEFGVDVLRAEVKHPGIGSRYVRTWGEDGASLCGQLTKDEAIILGKYVDDLASVPAAQRSQLLEVIKNDKDRFFMWLGRFVEENPGKTIGSATFLAVFLPNADRILGEDEIVYDDDGNPVVVHKPGLLGAPAEHLADAASEGISWLTRGIAIVVTFAIAVFAVIKLRGIWRRDSVHHRHK